MVNRDLAAQLEPWRLGDELPPFTAAVDAILGTQLPLEGSSPTPFHGFFVADVFLELEVLEGVALNLNLTTLNVTASGGFRVLSDILPGFAVSIHVPWSLFGEEPIYVDFVGPDLDLVTVGQGALLQDVFLEGFMAGLRWRDWELHAIFGGRVFWETDDYLYLGFEWNRRTLGVGYTRWFSGFGGALGPDDPTLVIPLLDAHYLSVHGCWPVGGGLNLGLEWVGRVGGPETLHHGILARADWTLGDMQSGVHGGYQFRFFQQGFGPLDSVGSASALAAYPVLENTYATQAFEFLGTTAAYDQWSHAVMVEGRYRLGPWEGFLEFKGWVRAARAPDPDNAVLVRAPDGRVLPGWEPGLFYSVGAAWYIAAGLPHFVSVFVSNKSVSSFGNVRTPVPNRFIDQAGLFIEGEVCL